MCICLISVSVRTISVSKGKCEFYSFFLFQLLFLGAQRSDENLRVQANIIWSTHRRTRFQTTGKHGRGPGAWPGTCWTGLCTLIDSSYYLCLSSPAASLFLFVLLRNKKQCDTRGYVNMYIQDHGHFYVNRPFIHSRAFSSLFVLLILLFQIVTYWGSHSKFINCLKLRSLPVGSI